ncbi:MAG TPA: ATP-binding protein [Polyangiaceae bacterium]
MSVSEQERRVLVLMPSSRDAERTVDLLGEAGMASVVTAGMRELCGEIRRGAGALLLTEEMLLADSGKELELTLGRQEPWSLVPVLLVARDNAFEKLQRIALGGYPAVTLVEQPVRARTLIGALDVALRGRSYQYQVRDALRERERQSLTLAAQDEKLRSALSTLSNQAAKLRSADKSKDEFLATLAHELRNPLAPITTGLSVLEGSSDPQRLEHTLRVMRRQVNHMVRLIDDLLDVSRITTGKLELKIERFTAQSAMDAAIEASMPGLTRGRHTLKTEISDDVLYLDADQTRIAQVVSNLLNNASKYTPSGGNVELSVRREGDEVVIRVRDDGMGIPPDRLEDIFQMFGQVNQALDRSHGGLGIGLALVRRLVEMHRGHVEAHSAGPGKGSTFTVRLPMVNLSAADSEATPERPNPETGAKRVLVVDDNEDAAELLGFMLEQEGFEAVIVKDGPAALETAGTLSPHVVILDIGLPGMNGYEVAMRLRQDERLSHVAIIALSGFGSPEDKRRALDAGFDLHLTKPVFAEDLRQALGTVRPAASSRGAE